MPKLIAILSDIHDNLANLKKSLDICEELKIKQLICCGDVSNEDTLSFLNDKFIGEIYLVRGNADNYIEEILNKFVKIKYFGQIGRIEFESKIIAFCHEPFLIQEIIALEKCDIIFYGHTHKPWLEQRDGVKIVNPGEVSGTWNKATFAIWDTKTDNLELKLL